MEKMVPLFVAAAAADAARPANRPRESTAAMWARPAGEIRIAVKVSLPRIAG
jgi:hypothetical protein